MTASSGHLAGDTPAWSRTPLHSVVPGGAEADVGAFADKVAFELGQSSEDGEDHRQRDADVAVSDRRAGTHGSGGGTNRVRCGGARIPPVCLWRRVVATGTKLTNIGVLGSAPRPAICSGDPSTHSVGPLTVVRCSHLYRVPPAIQLPGRGKNAVPHM